MSIFTPKSHLSLITCLIMTISGSAAASLFSAEEPKPHVAMVASSHTTDEYLQLASTATSPEQQNFQLMAVRRLLLNHQLTRASQILSSIEVDENYPDINTQKQLLDAQIRLANNKVDDAVRLLQQMILDDQNSQRSHIDYHQTLAHAYERQHKILGSIEQRSILSNYLAKPPAIVENNAKIWGGIQNLPANQLHVLLRQPLSESTRGWLELAQLSQKYVNSAEQLRLALYDWQRQYPAHPGNQILPHNIHPKQLVTAHPQHLFLLVPLHGKFGENGQAIRDGFMTAYYKHRAGLSNPAEIHIIDTSTGDIIEHYSQAIREQADFVVGPLMKANVQALATYGRLPVPTLALNQISMSPIPHLYQFGLSQQQEAWQIAERARSDGHQHAIIIAPDNPWGKKIADNFETEWLKRGGRIADVLAFQSPQKLSQQIRRLLHVNQSESRASDLKKLLRQNMRFVPRRRQDVDFIFLVATNKQAKTIRPMLRYYFAGNLPIYATSLIDNGHQTLNHDSDLNDIQFAQMPWMLDLVSDELLSTKSQAKSLWPISTARMPQFFALGMDAYQLTHDLSRLTLFPRHGIAGATGTLYLLPDQQIFRELLWAEFKNGQTYPIQ